MESQDKDVFVVLVANYKQFDQKNVYMKQKTSKECRVTNIGAATQGLLSAGLDPESIPLLHSLTGCNSTSDLYGIGKSTAWSTFKDSHDFLKNINRAAPDDIDYK